MCPAGRFAEYFVRWIGRSVRNLDLQRSVAGRAFHGGVMYRCEGCISLVGFQWLVVACSSLCNLSSSERSYCFSKKAQFLICVETMSEEIASQLYNKPEHRHTLVGNWQEEQKLLETTGTHRYKVLRGLPQPNIVCCMLYCLSTEVSLSEPFTMTCLQPWTKTEVESPLYATRQDKPEQLPTFERVFAHSERLVCD